MPNRNGQASESGASDSEQAEAAATAGTGSKLTRKDVGSAETAPPALIHKVKNKKSILVVAVSKSKIFAGTQGGDILVWSLDTYGQIACICAHKGAVLGLFVSPGGKLLYSSAGDAIVNVWCTEKFSRVYSIYSTYDVGDVFCVVYSARLHSIYLGAQNTSIQWYDFDRKDNQRPPSLSSHPSQRNHRFFDSKGPGGVSSPRPLNSHDSVQQGGQVLEIDKENIVQYAHYGYVYCMLLAKGLTQGDRDEEVLISGGGDGTIKLWQLGKESHSGITELATLEIGDTSVLSMAMDGILLYSGRLEGDINVWDLDARQLIQTVKAYNSDILTIAVGYGMVFTGGADSHAKIFERYKCKSQWKAHEKLILASAVASHNGNPILVTGGNDDCVAIWDIAELANQPARPSKAGNEQLMESLSRFISFKTVSSRPENTEECRRGASWLRNLFKRYGASTELFNTDEGANPVVFARFKGKPSAGRSGKRGKKILFYGHYDVVAADNEQKKWIVDPFAMQGRDGYLYGRGVSDNKGPVLAALYAVADLVAEQRLKTDVVFLIEGEEESGSRGFERAVQKNKHIIGPVDWILLANSYWLDDTYPCLTYGLRGVVQATIAVESPHPDLHSGVDGSHLMDEALKDLIRLLSQLSTPGGHITIPGFYSRILRPTPAETRRYAEISATLHHPPPTLRSPHRSLSSSSSDPVPGPAVDGRATTLQILQAKWREPSLTIHAIHTSSPPNSAIIPSRATATLSLRLVPAQDAVKVRDALLAHLDALFAALGTTNTLTVTADRPVDPWLGDPENALFQTLERAIVDAWGLEAGEATAAAVHAPRAPLYIREGGSIPAIRFLEKEFGAPAAQLPCGQASDGAHLDNERLRLVNLYKSREIFRRVFGELAMR